MPQPAATGDSPRLQTETEAIRDLLMQKTAEEIERELPGLINIVQTQELGHAETLRYIIGVSFSKNQTFFDYWVDRVVSPEDGSTVITRTEKEPIDSDHSYLTFVYPPDPQFDGVVLRGILLAIVEDRLESTRDTQPDAPANSGVRATLRSAYRTIMEVL